MVDFYNIWKRNFYGNRCFKIEVAKTVVNNNSPNIQISHILQRTNEVRVLWNGQKIWNTSVYVLYGAETKCIPAKRLPCTPVMYCNEFSLHTCCWSNAIKSNLILNYFSFVLVKLIKCLSIIRAFPQGSSSILNWTVMHAFITVLVSILTS